MRSLSKARGGRIAGYSTDEQRSGVRCMDAQECDFIKSPALRLESQNGDDKGAHHQTIVPSGISAIDGAGKRWPDCPLWSVVLFTSNHGDLVGENGMFFTRSMRECSSFIPTLAPGRRFPVHWITLCFACRCLPRRHSLWLILSCQDLPSRGWKLS